MSKAFSEILLNWYDHYGRSLPWRSGRGEIPDPYAVWLSEIMLQQTGVTSVKAYFHKFLQRWPDLQALAATSQTEILKEWAGLGYYSRARNLHACAQKVMELYQGCFPEQEADLLKLPGIGPYTAAAIASIAFDQRALVIDGNIERILSRLFCFPFPPAKNKSALREELDRLTPSQRCGDFAQAMMDLGSGICVPRKPLCDQCPVRTFCLAFATDQVAQFPVKALKSPRPHRQGYAFYIESPKKGVLVRTRPSSGLLGGMSELPTSPWEENVSAEKNRNKPPEEKKETQDLEDYAATFAPLPLQYRLKAGVVKHVFTHFSLTLRVLTACATKDINLPEGYRWVEAEDLHQEAFPTLMRKVIAYAQE